MTTSTPSVKAVTPEDDAAITKTLKKIIQNSKMLSKENINVSTKQGVVMFEGAVNSDIQVTKLIETAESIIGVTDVNASKLKTTDGHQPLADALTTAKIKRTNR